jgi:hypothetical protein
MRNFPSGIVSRARQIWLGNVISEMFVAACTRTDAKAANLRLAQLVNDLVIVVHGRTFSDKSSSHVADNSIFWIVVSKVVANKEGLAVPVFDLSSTWSMRGVFL